MAKEWYLLKSSDYDSGFGSDDFDDYASDGFGAALASSAGENVELYNYDLSVRTPLRAIITGTVQDSQESSMIRRILVPIGTCKAGMYIRYKDRYWLITGLVDDNHVYEKAVLWLCSYYLTWMDSDGRIHQRWCKAESAAQYNNGETSTQNFTIRSDQLMLYLPDDDATTMLDDGVRFVIDKRCKIYEKNLDRNAEKITSFPLATYELTRIDSVLYNYQDSGINGYIASQVEQRDDDGWYVIDGKGYWLCEHRLKQEIDDKISVSYAEAKIVADDLDIFCGLDAGIFTAEFFDSLGNKVIHIPPTWEILCDFKDELNIEHVGNSILISTDNDKLVNSSFELLLHAPGYDSVSVPVTIKAFI